VKGSQKGLFLAFTKEAGNIAPFALCLLPTLSKGIMNDESRPPRPASRTPSYRRHDPDLARRLEILKQNTHQELNRGADPECLFRDLTRQAAELLRAARVGMWMMSGDCSRLVCKSFFESTATATQASCGAKNAAGYPAYLKALRRRRCLKSASSNSRTSFPFPPLTAEVDSSTVSRLDAPLVFSGKLLGAICIEDGEGRRRWSQQEEECALALADLAALTYRAVQKQKSLELLKAFGDLARRLNACTRPETAVREIGRAADRLWGWDAFFLHFYVEQRQELIPILNVDTIDGRKKEVWGDGETPALCYKVLQDKGKLLLGESTATDSPKLIPFGDVTRRSASRMYIAIRKGKRVIAFLSIQSYTPDAYDDEAMDGLETLSQYCTGALERLYAVAQKRESEERFRSLAEASTECIILHGSSRIFEVNRNVHRVFGYDENEIFSCKMAQLIPPVEENGQRHGNSVIRRDKLFEGLGMRKSGELFPIEIATKACRYRGQPAAVTVVRDISYRKGIEQRLREHSRQILEAQEHERRRVSRDLHDSVNQILTASQFSLDSLGRSISPGDERAQGQLKRTRDLVAQAMQEIRMISWNLRPKELDELGLVSAMHTLCHDLEQRTGVHVCFVTNTRQHQLDSDAAINCFRILQEALGNAARHSGATRIDVAFKTEERRIVLEIRDNGAGFIPQTLPPDSQSKSGFGLLNMRERASFARGTLHLTSAPGCGTSICVAIPIETKRLSGDENSDRQQEAVAE
jgi:PAS domain S-box-containing protein